MILQHSAKTLSRLLRACYLAVSPTCIDDDEDAKYHISLVAASYGMHGVADILKSRWLAHAHVKKTPLCVYLVASVNQWKGDAWQAARQLASALASNPINSMYCSEMEIVGTSGHYHTLLKSLHQIHQAELEALKAVALFRQERKEAWKEPSFACTPSISPVVAVRAIQLSTKINHGHVVSHPAPDPGPLQFPHFHSHPMAFINRMVRDSKDYNQKREKAISAVSCFS